MSDLWVPFHIAMEIVTKSIGSKVLAWEELPRLLKEGHVRAIAECTDVDEVTGEHMRKYDAPVPLAWWSKQGRFRRSIYDSKMHLMIETKSQYDDHGVSLHHPHLYDNIRIFKTDLNKYAPIAQINDESRAVDLPHQPSSPKTGRRPKKLEAVIAAMRQVRREDLEAMREKEMEHAFGASRDTCRRARDRVLSKTLK